MYFSENENDISKQKETTKKKFGKKLKKIRTVNPRGKITQKELAAEVQLKGGGNGISRVERGKMSLPSEVLPTIADIFGVSVEDFFSDGAMIVRNDALKDMFLSLSKDRKLAEDRLWKLNYMAEAAAKNSGYGMMFTCITAVLSSLCKKGATYSDTARSIIEAGKMPEDRYLDMFDHNFDNMCNN